MASGGTQTVTWGQEAGLVPLNIEVIGDFYCGIGVFISG